MLRQFIFQALLVCVILSCNNNNESKNTTEPGAVSDTTNTITTTIGKDTLSWINDFKEFRTAVYQRNKPAVKAFIDFPIMNEGNEIWYLVNPNTDLPIDKIVPFTEKDFDKYFAKLFGNEFVKAMLTLKSADILQTGHSESTTFEIDSASTYQLIADFDKTENLLNLNFNSRSELKDEKGELVDGTESSIIYQFRINKLGRLKFVAVRMAG